MKQATEHAIYGDIPKEGTRREVPLLSILDKVATDAGQVKEYLKTLPTDIVTTSRQQQRKERMLEQIQRPKLQPIEPTPGPYVETPDDEEELQEELLQQEEEEELLQQEEGEAEGEAE